MTPTAAEVIDPTCQLQDAPEFWRFTPCKGNKVPINPGTNRGPGPRRDRRLERLERTAHPIGLEDWF